MSLCLFPHLQRRHVPDGDRVGVGCVTVLSVCDLAVHAVLFKIETAPDWVTPWPELRLR